MSLASVQNNIQSVLQGLPCPYYNTPLQTWIAPPVAGDDSTPQLYIWGSSINAARQTAPRGYGFKKYSFNVNLWLLVVQPADMPDSDVAFPAVIDMVLTALGKAPMPIPLTDPTTGEVSQLISIGERFSVAYEPVQAMEDERYVLYQAAITAPIEEARQQ